MRKHQLMNSERVTLHLPTHLYAQLQTLAAEEQTDLVGAISHLLEKVHKHKAWLRDLRALREQIQVEGGLQFGDSKEAMMSRLRQTRQEIFELEYEHYS